MSITQFFLASLVSCFCYGQSGGNISVNAICNGSVTRYSLVANSQSVNFYTDSSLLYKFRFSKSRDEEYIEMIKDGQVLTTYNLRFPKPNKIYIKKKNYLECDYSRAVCSEITYTMPLKNDYRLNDKIFLLGLIFSMSDFLPLDNFFEQNIDDILRPFFLNFNKRMLASRTMEIDSVFKLLPKHEFSYRQKHLFLANYQKKVIGSSVNVFGEIQKNREGIIFLKTLINTNKERKKYEIIDNVEFLKGYMYVYKTIERTQLRGKDVYLQYSDIYKSVEDIVEFKHCTSSTCLKYLYRIE